MKKIIMECWKVFSGSFPIQASKIMFYKTNKKTLNLDCPEWLDEKLQYLKLFEYSKEDLVSKCADKFEVREYVRQSGCDYILNDLIYEKAFDSVEEIPWNNLPNQFALKCTHGCHMNIISVDKTHFDIDDAKQKLRKWLKEKQWKEQAELHYKKIKPRIIIEKYIPFDSEDNNKLPLDYKIYCFNGKPEIILVCSERESDAKFNFYDTDWNEISCKIQKNGIAGKKIEKPKCLKEMLMLCEKLIRKGDFPFVRMDFYVLNEKPIFGEMTFTPSGCNDDDLTKEGQVFLGNMLDINKGGE